MGLFTGLMGGAKPYPQSEPEAVMGVLIAVIAADGDISDEEKDSFLYLANKTRCLGPMPAAPFKENVTTCLNIVRKEGASALMARCVPVISAGVRKPLFLNACDLIMRDGSVDSEEESLVEDLQRTLGIDDVFAQQAVSITLAKYSL